MSRVPVQRIDDPVYLSEQYATEHGLAARKVMYADITGLPLIAKRTAVVFVAEKAG